VNYTSGQIVLVDLGNPPNEIKGHEQAKKRPCLVIKFFSHLSLLTVIPITSKKQKYNPYSIVDLPKGLGNLKFDSYALCHQIRTISEDRILDVVGAIDIHSLLRVKSVVVDIFDF